MEKATKNNAPFLLDPLQGLAAGHLAAGVARVVKLQIRHQRSLVLRYDGGLRDTRELSHLGTVGRVASLRRAQGHRGLF